jgi:hypothetical protein
MACPTVALPQWAQQDGRYATASAIDNASNLLIWPNTANGTFQTQYVNGSANATHTVTFGPNAAGAATASINLIEVTYNDVKWWFAPNTPVSIPIYITNILASTGGPYTVS